MNEESNSQDQESGSNTSELSSMKSRKLNENMGTIMDSKNIETTNNEKDIETLVESVVAATSLEEKKEEPDNAKEKPIKAASILLNEPQGTAENTTAVLSLEEKTLTAEEGKLNESFDLAAALPSEMESPLNAKERSYETNIISTGLIEIKTIETEKDLNALEVELPVADESTAALHSESEVSLVAEDKLNEGIVPSERVDDTTTILSSEEEAQLTGKDKLKENIVNFSLEFQSAAEGTSTKFFLEDETLFSEEKLDKNIDLLADQIAANENEENLETLLVELSGADKCVIPAHNLKKDFLLSGTRSLSGNVLANAGINSPCSGAFLEMFKADNEKKTSYRFSDVELAAAFENLRINSSLDSEETFLSCADTTELSLHESSNVYGINESFHTTQVEVKVIDSVVAKMLDAFDSAPSIRNEVQNEDCVFKKDESNIREDLEHELKSTSNDTFKEEDRTINVLEEKSDIFSQGPKESNQPFNRSCKVQVVDPSTVVVDPVALKECLKQESVFKNDGLEVLEDKAQEEECLLKKDELEICKDLSDIRCSVPLEEHTPSVLEVNDLLDVTEQQHSSNNALNTTVKHTPLLRELSNVYGTDESIHTTHAEVKVIDGVEVKILETSDFASLIGKDVQNEECVFKKDESNINEDLELELKSTSNDTLKEEDRTITVSKEKLDIFLQGPNESNQPFNRSCKVQVVDLSTVVIDPVALKDCLKQESVFKNDGLEVLEDKAQEEECLFKKDELEICKDLSDIRCSVPLEKNIRSILEVNDLLGKTEQQHLSNNALNTTVKHTPLLHELLNVNGTDESMHTMHAEAKVIDGVEVKMLEKSDSASLIGKDVQNEECVFKKDESNIREDIEHESKSTSNNILQEEDRTINVPKEKSDTPVALKECFKQESVFENDGSEVFVENKALEELCSFKNDETEKSEDLSDSKCSLSVEKQTSSIIEVNVRDVREQQHSSNNSLNTTMEKMSLSSIDQADNELYLLLLNSSPSLLNQRFADFEKYLKLKLEINGLNQNISKLTMELRQKERELFEIRPNSAVLQSSKTSVEFPKGEDTKKELFEAYDKIKNLPVQNTKYANELNELKKEFDTIIQEVGVLKESNSKLENELVLAKEDNLKLNKKLQEYDTVMGQLHNKCKTIQSLYDKEKKENTKLNIGIQELIQRYDKAKEVITVLKENCILYEKNLKELVSTNSQLTEALESVHLNLKEKNKDCKENFPRTIIKLGAIGAIKKGPLSQLNADK